MSSSSASTSRPVFVQELLSRPLPPLHPPRLGERSNPPYSTQLASHITNALFHPLIETCLVREIFFSSFAHFLARKMQQDDMGKWLHGILHLHEGDYTNVKCWYRDMSEELISTFFKDGKKAAYAHVDRVARASGKTVEDCRQTSEKAEISKYAAAPPEQIDIDEVRRDLWAELVCILEQLEQKHGWAQNVEGSEAYTQDTGDISDKKSGMLLGEGWRQF